ncbi:MAG: site-specific DNA-methyltransferase [Treponema sp.]|uniref:DNA-methyltransferase n=1 Tax=Treponema sp. TaxID=166 RepID=UPI0025E49922|nr:DNA methyltransferase [Treponema sp.]MBQ9280762.1 site-specific DNA-methyltransferase [Treponema sp.]
MKEKAPRNRTLTLEENEIPLLKKELLSIEALRSLSGEKPAGLENFLNKTINADLMEVLPLLPDEFADLIIIDPPYNLTKDFGGKVFNARSEDAYDEYLASWFPLVCKKLKKTGSLYICGDWKCTSSLQRAVQKELTVLNRITWQREKGRGAASNWKNSMEDIWFAVKNPDDYYFDVEAVKQKRRVIAPYKENGVPKDWEESESGNFRLTYPGNFWDDISIPFWSMPENTDHPTQKSEKLYAKLILASSRPGDLVFDPFLGSGTASVVAKKLGRSFLGVELSEEYCLYAQKRLLRAEDDKSIQGYSDGVFWERNTGSAQKKNRREFTRQDADVNL